MKIGVIGTGTMGANHVRVLKNIPDVDEIVITDLNKDTLNHIAQKFGIKKTYTSIIECLDNEKLDGVIVATQPDTHKENTLLALERGCHVLVEKPITHDIDSAEEIIACARVNNRILTVGHVERFNPIVTKINEFLNQKMISNIYLIDTHRTGPFPKRLFGKIHGVLIDLSVHDFDIINYLVGKIKSIKSQIIRNELQEIYVKTLIDLENNIQASAEFSWISPRMVRTIEIYGDEGMIMGDFHNQEVYFYENDDYDSALKDNKYFMHGLVKSGKVIKYPIYKQEPLLLEDINFINAIKGLEHPLVLPEEALLALNCALLVKNGN